MNVQNALRDLDKHASEFNFPVLDNAYVEMAAARLTAFRDSEEWAIAFEVLGFSNRQGIFADDVYGFGSCLVEEGFISSTPVLSESSDSPLSDPESGNWLADWENWTATARGKAYAFAPTRLEYSSIGIEVPRQSGPGSLKEGQVLRFFIDREGSDELFMQEDELRAKLKIDSKMSVFLQTKQWQHPDVAGEEKPSDNISMRSLLVALCSGSPTDFQRGRPNTDWRHWDAIADQN